MPENISYQVKLIDKSVLKRIRWNVHFSLNQNKKQDNIKTTCDFKSTLHSQKHPDFLRKSFSRLKNR